MAKNNRVFVSFAVEDTKYRDFLIGQARSERSPFAFIDLSVKEPWDQNWKTNCRSKIKGCDGVIALISPTTIRADGARWEMRCAIEERVPIIGVQIFSDRPGAIPPELAGQRVISWTWDGIARFINSL